MFFRVLIFITFLIIDALSCIFFTLAIVRSSKCLISFESVREESLIKNFRYQLADPVNVLTTHQADAVKYVEQALDDRQPGPTSVLLLSLIHI